MEPLEPKDEALAVVPRDRLRPVLRHRWPNARGKLCLIPLFFDYLLIFILILIRKLKMAWLSLWYGKFPIST